MDSYDTKAMTEAQLVEERTRLLDEITHIDQQLADPDKSGPDGQPMTEIAYERWRFAAIKAKNAKLRQYRAVKGELVKRNYSGGGTSDSPKPKS